MGCPGGVKLASTVVTFIFLCTGSYSSSYLTHKMLRFGDSETRVESRDGISTIVFRCNPKKKFRVSNHGSRGVGEGGKFSLFSKV